MNNLIIFESTISEADKKALTIFLVLFVIVFVIAAAIGSLVRLTMNLQAKKASGYCYNTYRAGLLKSSKEYLRFGTKRSFLDFYKQSLIPVLLFVIGVLTWIIAGWATGNWDHEIFSKSKDLLFIWDFGNPDNYAEFFGLTLLSSFPKLIGKPHVETEHILAYIEAVLLIAGMIGYLFAAQAFISRAIQLKSDSKEMFSRDVKDLKKEVVEAQVASELPPDLPKY